MGLQEPVQRADRIKEAEPAASEACECKKQTSGAEKLLTGWQRCQSGEELRLCPALALPQETVDATSALCVMVQGGGTDW